MKGKTTKTLLLLTTLLTCLLMLSTATALPVATSEPVMDLVEEQEQLMELSITIEDIITSDCSLMEKKESLLQLKNDFEDIDDFLLGFFWVVVWSSTYLVMFLFPTIAIPINVILSVITGIEATIEMFSSPLWTPPDTLQGYIPYIILNSAWSFLLGPVVNLVILLVIIYNGLENRGILPDQSLTQTNILTQKNLSLEPIGITTRGQA